MPKTGQNSAAFHIDEPRVIGVLQTGSHVLRILAWVGRHVIRKRKQLRELLGILFPAAANFMGQCLWLYEHHGPPLLRLRLRWFLAG